MRRGAVVGAAALVGASTVAAAQTQSRAYEATLSGTLSRTWTTEIVVSETDECNTTLRREQTTTLRFRSLRAARVSVGRRGIAPSDLRLLVSVSTTGSATRTEFCADAERELERVSCALARRTTQHGRVRLVARGRGVRLGTVRGVELGAPSCPEAAPASVRWRVVPSLGGASLPVRRLLEARVATTGGVVNAAHELGGDSGLLLWGGDWSITLRRSRP